MDSLIAASARALAAGDALGALKRVALRDDPPALALRGIAMAQLGEHPRARELLRRAARGFGAHEELARARCVVAEAEVALAMRDLGGSPRALAAASATLEAHADRANALQARLIAARRLLLLGRLDEAAAALARLDARGLPPSLAAVAELTAAELALRSLRIGAGAGGARPRARGGRSRAACRRCWPRWRRRALRSIVPPRGASSPAASRRCASTRSRRSLASDALVVDACRRGLARRRRVAAAGAPAGAVRAGARARRGVARRCRSRSPDRDAPSAPAVPTRRIGRACGSRSAACARWSRRWRASRPPRAASSSGRTAGATSSCWRRPSTAIRRRWWRCSPTARPGRPRPWRWPWAPASAPCSARSSSSRPTGGCARSAGRGRAAGWRRRWPDSRRSCYSPLRCRLSRVASRRRSEARHKEQDDEQQDQQRQAPGHGARGRDRARVRSLRRRRQRARRHPRRPPRLGRHRRQAGRLRSRERRAHAHARPRLRRRHRLRRQAPLPDRRGAHRQDRSGHRRRGGLDPGARQRRRLGPHLGRRQPVGGRSTAIARSTRSIPRPARSGAPSSPTASSPA